MPRTRLPLAAAVLLCVLTPSARAAESNPPAATPPCASPEFRQFDFWVGDWDLVSRQPDEGKDQWKVIEGTPHDHVQVVLGDCALLQRFEGAPEADGSAPLNGYSLSKWDARLGKWRQVWVDNQGSWLVFTGTMKEGRMELRTDPREVQGKTIVMRQVFADISRDAMRWSWERSEDGGKTFTAVWKLDYKRSAAGVAKS